MGSFLVAPLALAQGADAPGVATPSAPEAAGLSDALTGLLQLTSFVDVNREFCAQHAPDTASAVQGAAEAWYARSDLGFLALVKNTMPGFREALSSAESEMKASILATLQAQAPGQAAAWCASLPALLQSAEWDVRSNYAGELSLLEASPLGHAPQAGHYACEYTSYDYSGNLTQQSPSYDFDLFADGWYSLSDGEPEFPGGVLELPEAMGRFEIHPWDDHGRGRVVWLSGLFAREVNNDYLDSLGDEPSTFERQDDGATLLSLEVDYYGTQLVNCARLGDNVREHPLTVMARAEDIETYLRDAKYTNPLPAGAGGLLGLYLGGDEPVFFLPEGYFYTGRFRWGYDALEDVCRRVGEDREPFYGEAVCGAYTLTDDTITVSAQHWDDDYEDNAQLSLSFSREGEGLRIDGDAYFPVAPAQDKRLDGLYSYSYGDFTGGSEYKFVFTPEGRFHYSQDSFINLGFLGANFQDENYSEGSYAIDGYTLTLELNDGATLQYNFYADPDNPQGFYLLGNNYTLGRKLQ